MNAVLWQRLHELSAALTRDLWGRYIDRLRPAGHAIPSFTSPAELEALYQLASACPHGAAALEIGSHLGASAVALAAGLARVDGHLYCVDTWANETMPDGPRDTWAEFQRNVAPFAGRITAIRKRSADLSDGDVPRDLCLAFLDGDHSHAATRADFANAARRLAPGGTVAFHDFGVAQFPGVTRVVGEALASGEWIMTGLIGRIACLRPAHWIEPEWLGAGSRDVAR